MIDLNEAVQRLCHHEGIRLQPYRCPAGYLTIGVGRNLETNPPTAEEINLARDNAEQGGFEYMGKVFDSDQVSCQRISCAAQALSILLLTF